MQKSKSVYFRVVNALNKWSLIEITHLTFAKFFPRANQSNQRILAENARIEMIMKSGYDVSRKNQHLIFKNKFDSVKILCRKYSSDIDVLYQLFIKDEFSDLFLLINKYNIKIKIIIDAGSNIGLSIIKFGNMFPDARIFAIEPSKSNFKILKENLAINDIKAITLNTGVWNSSTRLYFDRSFRDGKEWSISMTEKENSGEYVESVSFDDIVKKFSISQIDLLKIDIEGGEHHIFNGDGKGLGFLKITKVIAIEIHEEYDVSNNILSILREEGFSISTSGEYIIGTKL